MDDDADDVPASPLRHRSRALVCGSIATLLIPANIAVFWVGVNAKPPAWAPGVFCVLAAAQFVLGIVAAVEGVRYTRVRQGIGLLLAAGFGLVGLGGPVGVLLAVCFVALASAGSAWGRPLRLRGKLQHPELCEGSDWTQGEGPSTGGLDDATRAALEALWLHDARKEHASVPAFGRVAWMLAGVGAPADLTADVYTAALEEIDHARRCFALAAGYGGRSHTAEGMPDLLVGGIDAGRDPLTALAVESLTDGCLLEDYNADVAAACECVCEEPATRRVLARIAREERSHAELSWRILAFCLDRGGERVLRSVHRALETLTAIDRPTAVPSEALNLVARADADALRRHGRLHDTVWEGLWRARLPATRARAEATLRESSRGGPCRPATPPTAASRSQDAPYAGSPSGS